MDHLALQRLDIRIIDVFSDHLIEPLLFCLFFLHGIHLCIVCHSLYLSHDAGVMRRCDLCAVLPVNLVAVVLRRVVAGGDVDAGDTMQCADCKGQLRCRTQRFKHISLDAVGCQTEGGHICKFR